MARITTDVAFQTWASPRTPVFRVERAGKAYRASVILDPDKRTWNIKVRGKSGMYRISPLSNDGPTAKSIQSSVVCSAAWVKHVEPALKAPLSRV